MRLFPATYYKVCYPCHYSCFTCYDYAATNCLTCYSFDNRIYNSTIWACNCTAGYYDISPQSMCSLCTQPCLTCSLTSVKCTSCNATLHRELDPVVNTCNCSAGYY